MKYKLIIFDLDGTLVDAYKAVARSLNYTFKKLGLDAIGDDVIKRNVGWGDRNLIGRFVPEQRTDEALKIYRRHHHDSLHRGVKYLPNALKVLKVLDQKGLKLAIASNRPTKFSRIILKELDALKYFDVVLCADKVKKGKPAPDILLNILKKLSVKNHEALYVGDMMIDVQAGRKAHVRTIAVLTGSCTSKDIKPYKPYRIIRNIKSLMQHVS